MNNLKNQTVIRATLRNQDLIPAFLDELRKHRPIVADHYQVDIPCGALDNDEHYYWDSEDSDWLLNEQLFDALNDCAPEGFYFGAHPGDGSDFGYWENIDDV